MKMLLLGLSLLCLGFGCAKQSDNNTNSNANAGYYQVNQQGQCVSSNGQPVQQQLCQQNGNYSAYHYDQQGQCVSSTGQPVQPQLCQQTGGGGYAQQCYGQYSYNGQVYACGTQYNCSGYTMYNSQNQPVQCQ